MPPDPHSSAPTAPRSAPADRPSRIARAAAPVFEQHGYDGASTRSLAAAAGCNVATIAYHFGSKQGLYHAVLDEQLATLLAMPLPDRLPAPPDERVRTLTLQVHGFLVEHRSAVRILMAHHLAHGRLPEPVLAPWRERWGERLAAVRAALDVPLADRPLALFSLGQLLARYAITEPATLLPYTDGDIETELTRHLGDLAVRLLL